VFFIVARKPRVEYKGAVYHVIHRGNNREYIFEDAADKRYLLSSIVDIKDPMGLSLMGYVIMSNHYHLLVKTEKRALSFVMQKLNNNYARYYNKKIGRSGHVFGDRYKSTLITDNNYLFSVLRYIHLNPVKAEMTENSYDYKWSSDMHYRRNNNRFVDIDFVLDIISKNRKQAIKQYIELMGNEETLSKMDFVVNEVIENKDTDGKPEPEKIRTTNLDEILWSTGVGKEDFDLIKNCSRKRNLTPYKLEYIKLAQGEGYTLEQIANNINSTSSAIANLLLRNS
jgi:putative transposase